MGLVSLWRKRNIVILLIIFITVTLLSITFPTNKQITKEAPAEEEPGPDKQLKDIKLTLFSNNEEVNWLIQSGVISSFNKEGYLELSPLKIEALNPEKKETLYSISASKATYQTSTGIMKVTGPVIIKQDEMELEMDYLDLKTANNHFTGKGDVNFNSPFFQISGQGFEADLNLGIISFWGTETQQVYLNWE